MKKNMVKSLKTACIITAVTGLAAFSACAQAQQPTTGAAGDLTTPQPATGDQATKSFIKQSLRDNITGIDLAAIGANKAQNADLKALCEQFQKSHADANVELQPIAQKYGVVEGQPKRIEKEVTKFEKEASGPEFDKDFATEMLRCHQKAIARCEGAAAKLQEADVKQYAQTMLPKLREHFQHAEKVAKAVGVEQSTISAIVNRTPAAVGGATDPQEPDSGVGSSDKTDKGAGAKQPEPPAPPTRL